MDHQVNGELIPQGGGDSIPLARTPLTLGRRETCDICLHFPNVSGKHCELSFKEGLWILRDLESTNGVFINDERLDRGAKKLVHNGDVITIAQRSYEIQYNETGRASDLDEFGEELDSVISVPLLEKAGLMHAPRHSPMPPDDDDDPPLTPRTTDER
jgi:predicted component of type VI protein secretion system